MDQNTAAISALREYTKIQNPKYAFMIEAPWGSGKTHLVKREFCDSLYQGRARYATLNGVKDRRSFRRALLAETSEAKLADAIGGVGKALSMFAMFGNVGSIVQDAVEDRMIANLPDVLIFDDVERCEMSPAEIFGLINEFVEHKSKNVILCGFFERDDGTDSAKNKRELFLALKEKVVGRTVRIDADVGNALPEFINSMPASHGQRWFQSNSDLVLEVFASAKHSNLRVLRQCIHDCGRVVDVLEEDLRRSKDAMIRFVRTYLALSMALATGSIDSKQLADRSNVKYFMKPAEGEKPHPLYVCFIDHPHAEIFADNSASIIPIDLGVSLIGIGYQEPHKINTILRSTKQFSGKLEVPLWRRFVEWRKMPGDELERAYEAALSYVFSDEDVEPGAYLHLANDLIHIAKDGSGTATETAKKIEDRIKALSEMGKIPAAAYGRSYGWGFERGFSFGGYGFDINDLNKPLIDQMRNSQYAAFERTKVREGERLLGLLVDDIGAFDREFSWRDGQGGYTQTEILDIIDPDEFAALIFGHATSGDFKAAGSLLKTLADGHHNSESFGKEVAWAKIVKASLINRAAKVGHLERARMHWFLGFNWKFSENAEN